MQAAPALPLGQPGHFEARSGFSYTASTDEKNSRLLCTVDERVSNDSGEVGDADPGETNGSLELSRYSRKPLSDARYSL